MGKQRCERHKDFKEEETMSKAYNPEEIELKWQKKWEDAHCFEAEASHEKPKFYALIEFPYPSGAGLHVRPSAQQHGDGYHRPQSAAWRATTCSIPIGWDAFGLPTENYAIKNHVHPAGRDEEEHRPLPRAAQAHRLLLRLDARGQHHRPELLTSGRSGSSCSFISRGWPIRPKCRSTGAPSCKCGLANEEVVDGHVRALRRGGHPQA